MSIDRKKGSSKGEKRKNEGRKKLKKTLLDIDDTFFLPILQFPEKIVFSII